MLENLTIDQILNQIQDTEVEVYDTEKVASAPTSSFSENEIEEMAVLLKTASMEVSQDEDENPQEKMAEALLLSTALETLSEAPKFEEFKKVASQKGHSEEEINKFIEKMASDLFMKKAFDKKKLLMGLGIGMAAGGAGAAGGFQVGTERQKEKTREVGQAAFKAGRLFQHGRQVQRMNAFRQRLGQYLSSQRQKQSPQG
jgi:hypothetical protein